MEVSVEKTLVDMSIEIINLRIKNHELSDKLLEANNQIYELNKQINGDVEVLDNVSDNE